MGLTLEVPQLNTGPFSFSPRAKKQHRATWFDTEARPSQRPPVGEWRIWLLLAGRGFGKTRVLVEWAKEQARKMPGSRGAIVAATAADARDVLAEGPAGILATSDVQDRPLYEPSKRRITWPNGTMATLYSADEPNRLRGPQHHWAVCDEYAAWRYPETLDMLLLGLRLGQDPRVVIATTPRPTKEVKALLQQPGLALTRGTTYENLENLAPAFREQIIARYEGTRLGRQELNAELLEDVEGALWTRALLDADRVKEAPPLRLVVVGVDPKASQVADSETGIVVAGLGVDGHGYVLGDYSLNGSPEQWADKVATAYEAHEANSVVVERNNGGDMVRSVLKATNTKLPLELVWASRGKQTRAEPIVALYEQHRIHHVGSLPRLEDQLCEWVPAESDSPDRLDALVWALSKLMLKQPREFKQYQGY
jgi:phage terminase large subunit-like protein